MNLLQPIRNRSRRWVPRVMAPLAVVWLSMVLQPCVMAAEMGGAMGGAMGGQMDGNCPHCPTPMQQDCAAGACTYVDRVDYDGRTPYVRLANTQPDDHPVLFATLATGLPLATDACSTGPPLDATSALPTPPLNVLYCVYLN